MIRSVLGSRASIGGPLGSGRGGAAAQWWLSGGVSAANCIAAYQPIGAASLAASYTNLANPGTYDCTVGVAPTWAAATGWTFAAGANLLTGIVPANGWAAICRFSDTTANGGALFGSYTNTSTRFLIPVAATNITYQQGSYIQISPTLTGGNLAISGQRGYRNGTAEGSTIGAWSGTATSQIAIGGYATPAVVALLTGKIQAIAFYNTTLTSPQVAAIFSAMSAL